MNLKYVIAVPAVFLCACSSVNTQQNQRLDSLEEKVDALLVHNNKTYDILVDNELRISELEKDAKKRGVPVPQKLVGVESLAASAVPQAENIKEELPVQNAETLQTAAVGAITGQDLTKAEETAQQKVTENVTQPPQASVINSSAMPGGGENSAAAGNVADKQPAVQAKANQPAANTGVSSAGTRSAAVQKTAKPVQSAPAKAVLSSKDMYNRAYGLYRQRQYAAAEKMFDEFLTKYPQDVLAPNALYWKGETLYARAIYPQAIFAFKEVQTRYPKHPKTADSLLKTAMCYSRLGDTENASLHYLVLLEDWPNSEAAFKAKSMGAGK